MFWYPVFVANFSPYKQKIALEPSRKMQKKKTKKEMEQNNKGRRSDTWKYLERSAGSSCKQRALTSLCGGLMLRYWVTGNWLTDLLPDMFLYVTATSLVVRTCEVRFKSSCSIKWNTLSFVFWVSFNVHCYTSLYSNMSYKKVLTVVEATL